MSLERRVLSLAKNPTTGRVVEFFGPTVEFLTSPDDEHNDFCVLKGTTRDRREAWPTHARGVGALHDLVRKIRLLERHARREHCHRHRDEFLRRKEAIEPSCTAL